MSIFSTSTKCLILYLYYWNSFANRPVEWALWFMVADLQACVPEVVDFRRHILQRPIEAVIRPPVPPIPFLANTNLLPPPNAIYAAASTSTENTREPLLDWSSTSKRNGSINTLGAKSYVSLSTLTP